MFRLSRRSENNLVGVHPELVRVVREAIKTTSIDFVVIEGVRSIDRQRELVKNGASKTMRSRHLTGHAVDLAAWVDGTIRWDWPLYGKIAEAMIDAASREGVKIEWGGNWVSFKDGPHFQLSWKDYPA